MSTKAKSRFERFQSALFAELGDSCFELKDGRIMVSANEFSPVRLFRSLQAAIDEFAHFMPEEIK